MHSGNTDIITTWRTTILSQQEQRPASKKTKKTTNQTPESSRSVDESLATSHIRTHHTTTTTTALPTLPTTAPETAESMTQATEKCMKRSDFVVSSLMQVTLPVRETTKTPKSKGSIHAEAPTTRVSNMQAIAYGVGETQATAATVKHDIDLEAEVVVKSDIVTIAEAAPLAALGAEVPVLVNLNTCPKKILASQQSLTASSKL